MRTNLKIGVIDIKRKLRPDDDLEILQKSIKDKGVLKPILVDSNYALLDGLRRLRAVEANGDDLVPVIVAETYEEAVDALAEVHADMDPSSIPFRRMWEIQYDLKPLLTERLATIRRTPNAERAKAAAAGPGTNKSRHQLTEALKAQSSSVLQVLYTIYLSSMTTGPLARYSRELLDRIDSGELPPHTAKGLHTTFQRDQTAARKATDQAAIYNGVTNVLPGIVAPFEGLSSELDPKLSQSDLVRWEAVLMASGQTLRTALNKLRKIKGKV